MRPVRFYVWRLGGDGSSLIEHRARAIDFWPPFPGTEKVGGKRFIVRGDAYKDSPQPDAEVLSCGHVQDVRIWNGRKVYNRKRLCKKCAGAKR